MSKRFVQKLKKHLELYAQPLLALQIMHHSRAKFQVVNRKVSHMLIGCYLISRGQLIENSAFYEKWFFSIKTHRTVAVYDWIMVFGRRTWMRNCACRKKCSIKSETEMRKLKCSTKRNCSKKKYHVVSLVLSFIQYQNIPLMKIE